MDSNSHDGSVILPLILSNMASALSNLRVSMLLAYSLVSFFLSVSAVENGPSAEKKASYARAEAIPVSCLNRTTCVIFSEFYLLAFIVVSNFLYARQGYRRAYHDFSGGTSIHPLLHLQRNKQAFGIIFWGRER